METEKKYKLTDESINFCGRKLYRIEALKDFSNVKKGDKGGFIANERNLSQIDDCWIYDDAKVFDNAEIFDNALVLENALVFGNAEVFEEAQVFGNARVYGNVRVYGDAKVYGDTLICEDARIFGNANVYEFAIVNGNTNIGGDAKVLSNSDYIVFKNWWSSGRYFTWTHSNNMWSVGCFYGTGEELIEKAYKDSELSGREYERVVKYVESILKDGNTTTKVNKIKQCLIKITKMFNL